MRSALRPHTGRLVLTLVAAATLAASCSGSDEVKASASEDGIGRATDSAEVTTPPTGSSSSASIDCAAMYANAPVSSTIDIASPTNPKSALRGSTGWVEGTISSVGIAAGEPSTQTATIDGKERTVQFDSSVLVLAIKVTGTGGAGATSVSAGDDAEIRLTYDSKSAGGMPVATELPATSKAACAPGQAIRVYLGEVDTSQSPTLLTQLSPFTILLLNDDGTFVPMAPTLIDEKPFGISTIEELEAQTIG